MSTVPRIALEQVNIRQTALMLSEDDNRCQTTHELRGAKLRVANAGRLGRTTNHGVLLIDKSHIAITRVQRADGTVVD